MKHFHYYLCRQPKAAEWSVTTSFTKKQIFQFDFNTGLNGGEIGPGDSFSTSPTIYNDATEDMYVFMKVEMPTAWSGEKLYEFDVDSSWVEVEYGVYAYGGEEMTTLVPGEITTFSWGVPRFKRAER